MNADKKKGRLDAIRYIRQRLSKSRSGVIERALIIKWLDKAEEYDGVRRRYSVSSKIKRSLS